MRKFITSLAAGIASLFFTTASAQRSNVEMSHADSIYKAGYYFEDFLDGRVLMKSGNVENARLNYNAKNQQIAFMQSGQYMELTGLPSIDTVYIRDKKFVPYHEKFYQVVSTSTSMPLLSLITSKSVPQTVTQEHTGRDNRSTATVSNTATGAYTNNNYRSNFGFIYPKKFFLQKGKVLFKLTNQKDIMHIYPEKKDEIRQFVNDNNTDFNKEDDVLALLAVLK